MADFEHLEIVKRGKEAVNAYYETEIGKQNPLDLSDVDFSGKNIEGIDFRRAKLDRVNFTNATFTQCKIDNCILHDNFRQNFPNFAGALFTKCHFININFFSEAFEKATFSTSKFEGGSFHGCNYSAKDFSSCEFIGVQFHNCTFIDTFFDSMKLKHTSFNTCNLEKAHLKTGGLNNIQFSACGFTKSNLSNIDFSGVILTGSNFTDSNLKGVNFSNANLQHSIFDNSDLESVNFYETDISLVNFKNAKNLAKAKNLDKAHVSISSPGNVKYLEYCIRKFPEKYCDWEILRIFGKMPLFGASYTALVLIPLFFYFLAIYNDKIDIIKIWAKQSLSINHSDPLALLLIERLHPLSVPSLSLWLLLGTLCLAIASTIYALFCPSRIKEFSSDQWTDQLGHSLVHYWALSWKYRKTRLICLCFYIIGGIGVLWVIGNKVFNSAFFIWNNNQMTF